MKRSYIKRKSPLKKQATDTVSKLKQHLWQLCRQIIIKRHGSDCYSCGARRLRGSNLHCGHFIPSSICSTELRYALENLRPQCYRCNIHCSGNWPAYEAHLIEDGINPDNLKQLNRQTTGLRYDILWYQAKIQEYEAILEKEAA